MVNYKRVIKVRIMSDDNVENLNEYTLKKKDHIREILMTMPDKNGYYTPPYS